MWDQNQTRRKEGALQTGVQFKCLITSKERMGAIPIVNKQLDEVQKQQLEQARKTSELILRDHNAAKDRNKQLEMEIEKLKMENQELLTRKINPDIVVAEHPKIQQIKHEEREIVEKNILVENMIEQIMGNKVDLAQPLKTD